LALSEMQQDYKLFSGRTGILDYLRILVGRMLAEAEMEGRSERWELELGKRTSWVDWEHPAEPWWDTITAQRCLGALQIHLEESQVSF